jgi:hypothetical protein
MTVTLDDLARQLIWLAWKAVPGQRADGSPKIDKPPIDPRTGYRCSKTDPAIRMTRSAAEAAAHKYRLVGGKGGIGLLMLPFELDGVRWQLGGLDTDHCYTMGVERHAPWADPVFAILDSHYSETSPSGTGRHHLFVIEAGHIPDGVGKDIDYSLGTGGDRYGFELYTRAPGYLTFTGRNVQGDLQAISPFTLMRLFNALEAFKPRATKPKANGHFAQSDHDKALDILAHLPNTGDYDDYPKWVGVIAALHAATGGSEAGRRATAAWSKDGGSRTAQEGVDVLYEYFDRVPPRANLGHLVNEARDHGYEPYPRQAKTNGAASPSTPNGTGNAPAVGEDAKEKPRLLVDAANPDLTVAALRDILCKSGNLYDRGVPVRLAFDQAQRGMVAQVLTPDVLVLLAHSACRPYRVKTKADGKKIELDTRLPRDIAVMYLDWRGEWKLPALNGIASAPMLKDDGTILATAGYDQVSGMWCDDLPALGALVPKAPTKEEARAALALLRKTFKTFCFADAETVFDSEADVAVVEQERPIGHDESAMLAGLLTAVCRPSLDLAPAIVMEAPSISGAGTGKGMLARCMSLIAFGREPHAVTGGGDNKETDKRIAAELMEGNPMLFLDNLNNAAFGSDLLASVITERPSRVRVLGLSKMVQLNASAFVVLTGNGLSVAEDLARRVITVRLDAKTEDPEARPFKSNLRAEVLAKRPELLAALLTIWRWGRLTASLKSGKPLGSFERWTRWVRDPLLALGCKDVVEQVSRAKARDAERQFVGELFETWHVHHGSAPVAIRNLHEDVSKILDPQGRGRQFIASKVRKLIDTRAAGFTLTRQAGSGKWSTTTYALISAGNPEGHRGHRGHRPEGSAPVPPENKGAPLCPL